MNKFSYDGIIRTDNTKHDKAMSCTSVEVQSVQQFALLQSL